MHRFQPGRRIGAFEFLRIQPLDVDLHPVGQPAVHQRFGERFIGVLHAGIFADDADGHFAFRVVNPLGNILPAGKIGARRISDAEGVQHFVVQPFSMILQRHFIDAFRIQRRNHRFLAHVAEQGDLGAVAFGQRVFGAADQHIRLNPDAAQFGDAVLGRLGFQLACRRDERHQRDVDVAHVRLAHVGSHLADGLQKGQAFDVAHGAADFAQNEIQGLGFGLGKGLDGIRHMRDHLHGGTQEFAAAFAGDDIGIDPA